MVFFFEMVILLVFNSFNVVKNLKKPDLVARQKPPFYTTDLYRKTLRPMALYRFRIQNYNKIIIIYLRYKPHCLISISR